jgi:hypothetical protein
MFSECSPSVLVIPATQLEQHLVEGVSEMMIAQERAMLPSTAETRSPPMHQQTTTQVIIIIMIIKMLVIIIKT